MNKLMIGFFFPKKTRLRFYRRMAALMRGQMPLHDAVVEMRARAERDKTLTGWGQRKIYRTIETRMYGDSFATAMRDFAPRMDLMFFEAASAAGRWDDVFDRIFKVYGDISAMRKTMVKAIAPSFGYTILLLALIVLTGKILVPPLASIEAPSKWTGAGRLLYLSQQLVRNPLLLWGLVLFLVLVSIVVIWSMPNWTGQLRRRFDAIPPWSLYRLVQGSVWLVTVANLSESGVPHDVIVQRMIPSASPWLRERLVVTHRLMRSGHSLGSALAVSGMGFPHPQLVEDLSVFAQRPGFAEALQNMADSWSEEGLEQTELAAAITNIVGLLIVSIAVCLIFYGMINLLMQIMHSQMAHMH